MVSPVNNSSANAALRANAQSVDGKAKPKPTPGELPYTRSLPAGAVVVHEKPRGFFAAPKPEPRTSMESPHVPGAPGKLGKERVNIDPNGFPTHVLFSNSNGEVGIAHKVKRDESGASSEVASKPAAE